MKYLWLTTVLALGLSTVYLAVGQETKPQNSSGSEAQAAKASADEDIPEVTQEQPMSFWMDKKLEYSKSLLEHLTKADFAKLEKEANQMRRLGRIEGFVRRRNDDYRVQLRTFDMATTELMRHARRGNIEGATLAFNQLTSSCVACHVLLREGVD
jgi:hypothetical protein